jgi:hypothetical protein
MVSLLTSDIAGLFARLVEILWNSRPENRIGLYEVLQADISLELKDSKGRESLYTKRQQVRFLQDHVVAYQDQAWGAGDIFAEYHCTPGVPVDRYRDGQRYRVLISLRETKNRGDETEIIIDRTIRDGFTRAHEDFLAHIDHKTQRLTLRVTFPKDRPPTQIDTIEQPSSRLIPMSTHRRIILADGRTQVIWEIAKPRVFSTYGFRWRW